ncbi:Uncharacterized protein APZ42_025727 [Daphnia magna]|uniref:Uncharacterized protein n=1 Tax=Daphnia magna TaxID=35525 RepID=A0A162DCJ9_9CRUS|nr:Uncharacterized protein APZ42_025727 [Daphnia magna]
MAQINTSLWRDTHFDGRGQLEIIHWQPYAVFLKYFFLSHFFQTPPQPNR